MEYRKFGNTIIARIDKGEEILEQVKEIALKENIKLASIQALGAINEFTAGVFKTDEKKYYSNHFTGSFEIVSLTGTINTMDGEFYSHLHMSAGNDKGEVFGGHLNQAVVSATCEMVITLIDGTVDRAYSEEIGLNLFKFKKRIPARTAGFVSARLNLYWNLLCILSGKNIRFLLRLLHCYCRS